MAPTTTTSKMTMVTALRNKDTAMWTEMNGSTKSTKTKLCEREGFISVQIICLSLRNVLLSLQWFVLYSNSTSGTVWVEGSNETWFWCASSLSVRPMSCLLFSGAQCCCCCCYIIIISANGESLYHNCQSFLMFCFNFWSLANLTILWWWWWCWCWCTSFTIRHRSHENVPLVFHCPVMATFGTHSGYDGYNQICLVMVTHVWCKSVWFISICNKSMCVCCQQWLLAFLIPIFPSQTCRSEDDKKERIVDDTNTLWDCCCCCCGLLIQTYHCGLVSMLNQSGITKVDIDTILLVNWLPTPTPTPLQTVHNYIIPVYLAQYTLCHSFLYNSFGPNKRAPAG